ncbi:unnamed protein product, partial [Didymodactylos carnosus]
TRTDAQAKNLPFNPFDLTKIFSQKQFPLRKVAFSPANMPAGIEASPEKMLQVRLFIYTDTQRHHIGANFMLIPVNNSETNENVKAVIKKDYRKEFHGPEITSRQAHIEHATYKAGLEVLDDQGSKNLIDNMVEHLEQCTDKDVVKRAVAVLANVDDDFGKTLAQKLRIDSPKR